MNKVLGLDELPQFEKLYLEVLAEAYNNATSWDTRRQVLSIMSGVASYNIISMYIPGLTKYRYTMANLHCLQFGRGAPIPKQPTIRIRIDIKQLDHFISFISPNLVPRVSHLPAPWSERGETLVWSGHVFTEQKNSSGTSRLFARFLR